jgi:hypothetical protein
LPLCFQFLGRPADLPAAPEPQPGEEGGCSTRQPSTSTWSCPQCGGPMIILERLTAAEIYLRSPPRSSARFS